MSHNRLVVITNAIQTAFIDHPTSGPGMTWDQIIKSDEESWHFARAVLVWSYKAGSQFVRKKLEDYDNT